MVVKNTLLMLTVAHKLFHFKLGILEGKMDSWFIQSVFTDWLIAEKKQQLQTQLGSCVSPGQNVAREQLQHGPFHM